MAYSQLRRPLRIADLSRGPRAAHGAVAADLAVAGLAVATEPGFNGALRRCMQRVAATRLKVCAPRMGIFL